MNSWPETPFRLIASSGIATRPSIPRDHYCILNAQLMALTHNTIFRGLNAVYHQAPLVEPSSEAAADLLQYCQVIYQFLHEHHTIEETTYFPAIEAASGIPGLMDNNIEQHHQLEIGLEAFQVYASETSATAYRPEVLRKLIVDMAGPLETHLHEEIPSILDLHDKIDSKTMRKIYASMHDEAERKSDKFKAGPFVLGNQDNSFLIDGTHIPFPEVPSFVPYLVDWILTYRHRKLWRFNSSDLYGKQKPFPSSNDHDGKPPLRSAIIQNGNLLDKVKPTATSKFRWSVSVSLLFLFYVAMVSGVGTWRGLTSTIETFDVLLHLSTAFLVSLILVPSIVV